MASPLDRIKTALAAGFRGKLKPGTLRRLVPGAGVDAHGDPKPGTAPIWGFEGIRESYDAAYRARAGIPQTDCRILIIAGLIGTDARQGDQLFIEGRWHQVRKIEDIDPAGATITLQCYEIADPT